MQGVARALDYVYFSLPQASPALASPITAPALSSGGVTWLGTVRLQCEPQRMGYSERVGVIACCSCMLRKGLQQSSRLTHGIIQCALELLVVVVVCARVCVWVCGCVCVCLCLCLVSLGW